MLSTKLKEAAGNSADATLYVDDVFSTYLYTGNGSTQTITNGIDLAGKGGLVWTKDRTSAIGNELTDTVRGAGLRLISNGTNAQGGAGSSDTTSFTSTGFGLTYNNGGGNLTGESYVSWTFRKAAKFFDVVTYTGNGTSNRAIAHSLGIAPGMVIIKCYGAAGDNWMVWHRSLPLNGGYPDYLMLNSTAAKGLGGATIFGNTTFDASNIYVGTGDNTNRSGQGMVAYLFAHDTSSTGIIQCGSFSYNNSIGNDVNLGWEPQYVMIKDATTAGAWWILDTMRGFSYSQGNGIRANTSQAEQDAFSGDFRPTATGFRINAGYYTNADNLIYMAIRMPNKPPTLGTQVFSPLARAGNNTQTNVTGVGFSPDVWMVKGRNTVTSFPFFDRLRGVTKRVVSNSSLFEETFSGDNGLISLNMDGITIGSGPADGGICNDTGTNYGNWFFKRAPGFFDEVCYTGTGSATTQAHNLTVVPELMIVKERSATNNWWVYVSSEGNTKYSVLNSTAVPVTSSTAWNNTTPTASVFSIGTATNVNASGQTFVAYLFATLAGISKVGSYTGNGTGQAIACGFSAGARFVLIKQTDNSSFGWFTFDSARGLTVGSSPYLFMDSNSLETTGDNGVYASTGGFTLGATAITTTNILGASYIFLSVA